MQRILVVDDESRIRDIIKKYATFEGFDVTEAADGMQAIGLCRANSFDLIIMDVMMPELDGFSACREIRKFSGTPVIMLSARGEEYDRIHGFELGIDDNVVKPFSPKELMLRISAILKRSGKKAGARDIFQYEGLTVDFTARIVTVNGERVEMTPKEYDLFFYLVKNRGIAHQQRLGLRLFRRRPHARHRYHAAAQKSFGIQPLYRNLAGGGVPF